VSDEFGAIAPIVGSVVDVAGVSRTQLTRINNKSHVAGVFYDALNEAHGLTGKPAPLGSDD